jgi:hypothetical protein
VNTESKPALVVMIMKRKMHNEDNDGYDAADGNIFLELLSHPPPSLMQIKMFSTSL